MSVVIAELLNTENRNENDNAHRLCDVFPSPTSASAPNLQQTISLALPGRRKVYEPSAKSSQVGESLYSPASANDQVSSKGQRHTMDLATPKSPTPVLVVHEQNMCRHRLRW